MNRRKALLVDAVLKAWDEGLRSPALVASLLNVSRVAVWRIQVEHNRRKVSRHDRADTLAGCSSELRQLIDALETETALTESSDKLLKLA